jgi:hypothetical protein
MFHFAADGADERMVDYKTIHTVLRFDAGDSIIKNTLLNCFAGGTNMYWALLNAKVIQWRMKDITRAHACVHQVDCITTCKKSSSRLLKPVLRHLVMV